MGDHNKGNWLTCPLVRGCGNGTQRAPGRRSRGGRFVLWCRVVSALIILFIAVPASAATKPLYLDTLDIAPILTRTPPTGRTFFELGGDGASGTVSLSPATQAALSLAGGNIPVSLWIARNPKGTSRSVTVTLAYTGGSTGTIGSDTQVFDLVKQAPPNAELITFNITAVDTTLNPNTIITLTVTNNTTPVDRLIRVYSTDRTTHSMVALNSDTVINVDSVEFYGAAYPAGSLINGALPGTTVYIRPVVSDPFGSYDISGATIDIIDPNTTTVVSGGVMTEVSDSGTLTKTYEYSYVIPAAGPQGTWTAQVTASEGTEGTITHTGLGTVQVGAPDIILMKSVLTYSDPVNGTTNPKAIPGAQMLYTVQATNQGAVGADSGTVVITDPIPVNTELYVGDLGGAGSGPVIFVDGATASGLTYTFTGLSSATDDVDFSNDGGATYTYTPTPDIDGYDSAVTDIRVNPKGLFNYANGGNPSFEVRFRLRVQ